MNKEIEELITKEPMKKPTTCGVCGRRWDDAVVTGITPVPSGRCPFEYDHEEDESDQFIVTVSNSFEAESYEDAVIQMVCWLQENAAHAGYRVEMYGFPETSHLIDADNVDFNKAYLDQG